MQAKEKEGRLKTLNTKKHKTKWQNQTEMTVKNGKLTY